MEVPENVVKQIINNCKTVFTTNTSIEKDMEALFNQIKSAPSFSKVDLSEIDGYLAVEGGAMPWLFGNYNQTLQEECFRYLRLRYASIPVDVVEQIVQASDRFFQENLNVRQGIIFVFNVVRENTPFSEMGFSEEQFRVVEHVVLAWLLSDELNISLRNECLNYLRQLDFYPGIVDASFNLIGSVLREARVKRYRCLPNIGDVVDGILGVLTASGENTRNILPKANKRLERYLNNLVGNLEIQSIPNLLKKEKLVEDYVLVESLKTEVRILLPSRIMDRIVVELLSACIESADIHTSEQVQTNQQKKDFSRIGCQLIKLVLREYFLNSLAENLTLVYKVEAKDKIHIAGMIVKKVIETLSSNGEIRERVEQAYSFVKQYIHEPPEKIQPIGDVEIQQIAELLKNLARQPEIVSNLVEKSQIIYDEENVKNSHSLEVFAKRISKAWGVPAQASQFNRRALLREDAVDIALAMTGMMTNCRLDKKYEFLSNFDASQSSLDTWLQNAIVRRPSSKGGFIQGAYFKVLCARGDITKTVNVEYIECSSCSHRYKGSICLNHDCGKMFEPNEDKRVLSEKREVVNLLDYREERRYKCGKCGNLLPVVASEESIKCPIDGSPPAKWAKPLKVYVYQGGPEIILEKEQKPDSSSTVLMDRETAKAWQEEEVAEIEGIVDEIQPEDEAEEPFTGEEIDFTEGTVSPIEEEPVQKILSEPEIVQQSLIRLNSWMASKGGLDQVLWIYLIFEQFDSESRSWKVLMDPEVKTFLKDKKPIEYLVGVADWVLVKERKFPADFPSARENPLSLAELARQFNANRRPIGEFLNVKLPASVGERRLQRCYEGLLDKLWDVMGLVGNLKDIKDKATEIGGIEKLVWTYLFYEQIAPANTSESEEEIITEILNSPVDSFTDEHILDLFAWVRWTSSARKAWGKLVSKFQGNKSAIERVLNITIEGDICADALKEAYQEMRDFFREIGESVKPNSITEE